MLKEILMQSEVTGAVATVGEPMTTGGYRIFADNVYLAKGTKLYPPSAIEAAVRAKLEEAALIAEAYREVTDGQSMYIADKIRALMDT